MALHGSSQRSILVQGQVRPKPVVVVGIFAQQFAQMALIDDDQVIQTIPSDRSDQALNVSVLPRRTRCRWSIPNPHDVQPLLEDFAKGAVTIPNKMARRTVPGKGFGDLMRKPFCRRMRGHADMDQLSSPVMQGDEAKQHPYCDRWNDEQIDGDNRAGVIVQKGPPGLRWRSPDPQHVLRHRRLGNIDPEPEQFAVNARCSPQRISVADLADQIPHVLGYAGSAQTASRLPPPKGSEASTAPAHDRVRPDDSDRIQYARPKPIKQDEQQSVQRPQVDALRRRAAQDDELLSKDEDLGLKPGARPEQQEQRTQQRLERLDHRASVTRFGPPRLCPRGWTFRYRQPVEPRCPAGATSEAGGRAPAR